MAINLSEKAVVRINLSMLITALVAVVGGTLFIGKFSAYIERDEARAIQHATQLDQINANLEQIKAKLNSSDRALAIVETVVATQARAIEVLQAEVRSLKGR